MLRRLLVPALLTVFVACGGSGDTVTTGGGDVGGAGAPFVATNEEPRVDIVPVTVSARGKASVQGFTVNVSGRHRGSSYSLPNFVIKGAGVQGISQPPYGLQQFTYPYMTLLAGGSGANCIRCYGASFSQESPTQQTQDVQAALNWAANATTAGNPMYVAVGITMETSSQLNYTNPNDPAVVAQRTTIEEFVTDVQALDNSRQLAWIIGNELCTTPGDAVHTAVYQEINRIAAYIDHGSDLPCTTAVPQVSTHELQLIASACPDLDFLCVNDYYGHFGTQAGGGQLNMLAGIMSTSRTQSGGWTKPYVVSEFGSYVLASTDLPTVTLPNTPSFTAQGYYGLEANSTLVAADYLSNYQNYIQPYVGGSGTCLGSFAYVWENPVFSNLYAYFYEMFVTGPTESPAYNPAGNFRLQAVDSMVQAWGGNLTTGPYPQIVLGADGDPQGINCTFKATASNLNPTPVSPGQSLSASISATYGSALTYNWYIVDDTAQHYNPQNYEGTSSTALAGTGSSITFNAPSTAGNYQLRVTITDGTAPATQAPAATAAVFFVVQ